MFCHPCVALLAGTSGVYQTLCSWGVLSGLYFTISNNKVRGGNVYLPLHSLVQTVFRSSLGYRNIPGWRNYSRIM